MIYWCCIQFVVYIFKPTHFKRKSIVNLNYYLNTPNKCVKRNLKPTTQLLFIFHFREISELIWLKSCRSFLHNKKIFIGDLRYDENFFKTNRIHKWICTHKTLYHKTFEYLKLSFLFWGFPLQKLKIIVTIIILEVKLTENQTKTIL